MKYRLLSDEELKVFEEEFKHFLIVNGVHSEVWEEMNKSNSEKVMKLVEMFSDTVLQKVYEKIRYIEHRSPGSCLVFKLGEDNIELISINVKEGADVDLSSPDSIHYALVNNSDELTIFKTQKAYTKERELEIHEMIEQGCVHSDESFWNALEASIY